MIRRRYLKTGSVVDNQVRICLTQMYGIGPKKAIRFRYRDFNSRVAKSTGTGTIQLCLVHPSFAFFAFAGLWGVTLFRVPRGRGTAISSYWVLKVVCFLLLGVLIIIKRESLVFMNTGGPVFTLLAESQRDEEAGSPVWDDLKMFEELPSLEGEHGHRGMDEEAGPSRSMETESPKEAPEPKRRFVLDERIKNFKTRQQIARDRKVEEENRRWMARNKRLILEELRKIRGDHRPPFTVSDKMWEDAAEAVLRETDSGGEDWVLVYKTLKELRECREKSTFYQAVRKWLVEEKDKRVRLSLPKVPRGRSRGSRATTRERITHRQGDRRRTSQGTSRPTGNTGETREGNLIGSQTEEGLD